MSAPVEVRSTTSDFVVVQALGKGSYGSVNKVKRKQDGQFYAIKEVNIKKLQPREREDAVNEIRIMASIKHKNIVRYCDAFVERDSLFIVMEFAEHGDISRQIDKFKAANKYIKEDTVWSYLIQMCYGLHCMHSRNVLHRDIKPKNIFLTGKNHLRLGDLGCAKLMKAGMARTQIGTPYYMSPEIWCNKPYDARSDVWALGCLLYELTMLAPPFLANDMAGLAAKVKTQPAPRISKHYSEELSNLVASMLSKDPKSRPDIKTVLASPAVAARIGLLPPPEDDPRWSGEEMRVNLISTIKVPAGFGLGGFGMGGRLGNPVGGGLVLPRPDFPLSGAAAAAAVSAACAAAAARPHSSPSKLPGGGAAAAAAAPVIEKENSAAAPSKAITSAPPAASGAAAPSAAAQALQRRPLSAGAGNVVAQPAPAKGGIVAGAAAPSRSSAQPPAAAGGILPAYAPPSRMPSAVVPPVALAGIAGRAQAAAAAAAAAAPAPRAPAYYGAPSMLNRAAPSAAMAVPELRRGAAAPAAAAPIAGRLGLVAPAAAAPAAAAAYLYGARGGVGAAPPYAARPLIAGRPYY